MFRNALQYISLAGKTLIDQFYASSTTCQNFPFKTLENFSCIASYSVTIHQNFTCQNLQLLNLSKFLLVNFTQ